MDKIEIPQETRMTLVSLQNEVNNSLKIMNLIIKTIIETSGGSGKDKYKVSSDFTILSKIDEENVD